MTLGCPEWDLPTVIENLSAYGFDAVDLRGIQGRLDISRMKAFTSRLAETQRMLVDHHLAVSCISTSIRLCQADKRREHIEEARRIIPVALGLGAPMLRIFPKGDIDRYSREELASFAATTVERILALDGADRLHWCVETHDHWVTVSDMNRLLDACSPGSLGVTWDVAHTCRFGKEQPAHTYEVIGSRIRNVHVKDATYDPGHPQAMADGWRYVAPGEGQIPLTEAVGLLLDRGYDGYFTFEHEKLWHPELDEPEQIFPKAAIWLKQQLAN